MAIVVIAVKQGHKVFQDLVVIVDKMANQAIVVFQAKMVHQESADSAVIVDQALVVFQDIVAKQGRKA